MIKVENVLKIADIHTTAISAELHKLLFSQLKPTWKDQMDSEDIFGIEDIYSQLHTKAKPAIRKELSEITALLNKHDCSYFRIVT